MGYWKPRYVHVHCTSSMVSHPAVAASQLDTS